MTKYYFTRKLDNSKYRITKTDSDGEILDVYEAVYNEYNQICSCPAYTPKCKHLRWLKQWIDRGADPIVSVFNDKSEFWEKNPFFNDEINQGVSTILKDT